MIPAGWRRVFRAWVYSLRYCGRPMRHRMGRVGRSGCAIAGGARDRNPAPAVPAVPRRPRTPPAPDIQSAIDGIAALLRGKTLRFLRGPARYDRHPAVRRRVYDFTRTIPRGETLTYGEVAAKLRASGAAHSWRRRWRESVHADLPCHRVLEAGGYADRISPNGGSISKTPAAVDRRRRQPRQQDAVRRAASGCSAAPAGLKSAHDGHTDPARRQDLRVRLPVHRRAGLKAVSSSSTPRIPSLMCARAVLAAPSAGARSSW